MTDKEAFYAFWNEPEHYGLFDGMEEEYLETWIAACSYRRNKDEDICNQLSNGFSFPEDCAKAIKGTE